MKKPFSHLLFLALLCPAFLAAQPSLQLEAFASGFTRPLCIANAGDERLFVVEQPGRIRIVMADGTVRDTAFLDIRGQVLDQGSEQGLLGLAFPPNYSETGHFYVNYTTGSGTGRTRVSRFSVDPANPNVALPGSEEVLINFSQPFTNHNGGDLRFGPDGLLYIATGDGGLANDPFGNAQNMNSYLGKLLRIDIDTAVGYRVPPDNPYVGIPGRLDLIWAIGLRNPWRFSFDRFTGDLWIGDVGQGNWEEIDFTPLGTPGGVNYGWDCFEGTHDFEPSGCNGTYAFPIFEYPHNSGTGGFSVTGGFVYRGQDYPEIYGDYIFADYVSGNFWTTSVNDTTGNFETWRQNNAGNFIASFGEDADGELYAASLGPGIIYKLSAGCPEISVEVSIALQGDSLVADRIYGQFQWFLNGEPIAGATRSWYTPQEDGAYQLRAVINQRGCHYTAWSNTYVSGCDFPSCSPALTLAGDTLFAACVSGQITWLVNGVAVDSVGSSATFLIPFVSGTYQVAVYDSVSALCVLRDSSNVLNYAVNAAAGAVMPLTGMYPNPAGERLYIDLPGPAASLQVFDATGRQQQVPVDQSYAGITLHTAGLAPGLYVVRIVSEGVTRSGSFVKEP